MNALLRNYGKRNKNQTLCALTRTSGIVSTSSSTSSNSSSRLYHKNVVDHFTKNREIVGAFDKKDANVGTGLVGAPGVRGRDETPNSRRRRREHHGLVLQNVRVRECDRVFLGRHGVGERTTRDKATQIKNSEIANHLNLPPVKLHCSMLAEDAIKAAVKDVKEKQAKAKEAAAMAGGGGEVKFPSLLLGLHNAKGAEERHHRNISSKRTYQIVIINTSYLVEAFHTPIMNEPHLKRAERRRGHQHISSKRIYHQIVVLNTSS